jgi:hypothetical protein
MNGSCGKTSWKRPPPTPTPELNGPKGSCKNGKGGGGGAKNVLGKVRGGPKGSWKGLGCSKNELKSTNGSVKAKILEWNGWLLVFS